MVDEYELVSREELDSLRKKAVPIDVPIETSIHEDELSGPAVSSSKIIVLNNNVEKLNHALKRLLMLFDQAQKEMIEKKPESSDVARIFTQNEKIANGVISMGNMIRDQQIQLNQLNLLYRRQQELLQEIRLQRRTRPVAAFKIPPKQTLVNSEPIMPSPRPMPAPPQAEFEIETGPKIGQQILEEEKTETYPMLNTMLGDAPPAPAEAQAPPAPPPTNTTAAPLPESNLPAPTQDNAQTVDLDTTGVPPPPTVKKRGFLNKLLKK
ncbi:MAG: hypothetical protein KKG59_04260 [Nanoarchaeota archaeon]|nr:hypothetical protein [Nanoarchaeota archaeon]